MNDLTEIQPSVVAIGVDPVVRLIVATIGGAAVGVERQRSGHASGPGARLGGIRTLTLIGSLGGVAGMLMGAAFQWPATLLVGGCVAVIVAGYVRASRSDIDATTEIAAIVVIAAGLLSGLGQLRLAAGLTTMVVLLLAEKPRLHGLVARLDEPTLLAAARFAVMSAVVLPLLPEGPFGPEPGVRPRDLWILVLLFSGISFVGFVAQRSSGAVGYPLIGMLGGLVSSTSVTLTFARTSRSAQGHDAALATGAVAASTVLFARVVIAVAVLHADMLPRLLSYLAAPVLVALIALGVSWRTLRDTGSSPRLLENPLQFRSAIEMALVFQVVLFAVFALRGWIGNTGLLAGGFVLGLTDIDALTLSMARSADAGTTADIAARAIVLGIVANSLLKAAVAVAVGGRRFKWQAGVGLSAIAASAAASLLVL